MNAHLVIVIVSLLLSAVFSGLEIAFLTANKLRIELLTKKNHFSAGILSFFIRNSSQYIITMLVGNCIALVVFSIFMAEMLAPFILVYTHSEAALLFVQTLISTIVILFGGEFIPKNLFRINPNRVLLFFAVPIFTVYWLLSPFVFLVTKFSEYILKIFLGIKMGSEKVSFGRTDLYHYVQESISAAPQKENPEHEVKIFRKALDFSKVKVRDCMVPRTEIVSISAEAGVEELKNKFIETHLSKILVYRNNRDNIIGYVHSYEMFKKPESITSILLPVLILPESMPANDALTLFLQQQRSAGVVVDEFGGTAGMLTIEDVMEEIFGEIEDEHDKEKMTEQQIGKNEFIFSGRLEIDYLNEKYKLGLPVSEEYSTMAGLILHIRQSFPKPNEAVVLSPYLFKIISSTGTTIEKVQLKIFE